jgi:hypothetical protein
VKFMGVLGGFSVKPTKDGGLEGRVTVHFSADGEESRELTEMMRALVTVDIERAQAAMFASVDRETGEVRS